MYTENTSKIDIIHQETTSPGLHPLGRAPFANIILNYDTVMREITL